MTDGFARDGYLVLRGALPVAECEAMGQAVTGEYARLRAAGWRFAESGKLAGNLNFNMGPAGQDLLAAMELAGLTTLAAGLAGEPVTLVQAVGNLNLPGSSFQDFHIDGNFDQRIIIVNICLVDTDISNGATEIVPQSHQYEMSYWRFRREGWAIRAIAPTLARGDVLIRPSNLWHRGTPNRTATPRPMAAFAWLPTRLVAGQSADVDLARPLTIYGNKYYGRFRRIKEFMAVRLPWVDEVLRLGRSFLGELRG